MNHIETVSRAEAAARLAYARVTGDGPVKATREVEGAVRRYVGIVRRIDELRLEASECIGVAMEAMKGSPVLVTEDGLSLATWRSSQRKKVDYAGIMAELDVPREVIDRHTEVVSSTRTFTVTADWMPDVGIEPAVLGKQESREGLDK